MKRIFLIVLDSFGIGAMPDAPAFGDINVNTLATVSQSPRFSTPNLQKLGLFNIDGVTCGTKTPSPLARIARMTERSAGKDTTIGHWEIAGIVSEKPMPTYPLQRALLRYGSHQGLWRRTPKNRQPDSLHLSGQRIPDCRP